MIVTYGATMPVLPLVSPAKLTAVQEGQHAMSLAVRPSNEIVVFGFSEHHRKRSSMLLIFVAVPHVRGPVRLSLFQL